MLRAVEQYAAHPQEV